MFPFYFPIKTLFDFCFSLFRLQITFLSLPFSSFLNSQITAQTHHTLSLSLSRCRSFSLFLSLWVCGFCRCFQILQRFESCASFPSPTLNWWFHRSHRSAEPPSISATMAAANAPITMKEALTVSTLSFSTSIRSFPLSTLCLKFLNRNFVLSWNGILYVNCVNLLIPVHSISILGQILCYALLDLLIWTVLFNAYYVSSFIWIGNVWFILRSVKFNIISKFLLIIYCKGFNFAILRGWVTSLCDLNSDVNCSYRVLGSIHNSSRSLMLLWNPISTYVFGKHRRRIALLLLIWVCQCSLWGGLLPQTPRSWIQIPESLLWKVGHCYQFWIQHCRCIFGIAFMIGIASFFCSCWCCMIISVWSILFMYATGWTSGVMHCVACITVDTAWVS